MHTMSLCLALRGLMNCDNSHLPNVFGAQIAQCISIPHQGSDGSQDPQSQLSHYTCIYSMRCTLAGWQHHAIYAFTLTTTFPLTWPFSACTWASLQHSWELSHFHLPLTRHRAPYMAVCFRPFN